MGKESIYQGGALKSLYIIGAGSVGGHLATNLLQYHKDYEIIGFFDDDPNKCGSYFCGYPVFGPVEAAFDLSNVSLFIGIAFPKVKQTIVDTLCSNLTIQWPTFIHERAWVSENVKIRPGSIIYPGSSINYGSVIGEFVVMNMNCAIGHHTTVGSYSSLAPSVSTGGHTKIGESVEMGIGSSTLQNVHIGQGSIVGGGSVVIRDVKSYTTVVGVPAREVSNNILP